MAVGQVIRTGFIKTHIHRGFRHQRSAFGNFIDALENMLCLRHFRGANQIQHFGLRLHHVWRNPAGISDGVMHAGFFNDVLVEEVAAGSHQRDGI
ncbi:hypothetical protein D3C75_948200 [compost metagenome]